MSRDGAGGGPPVHPTADDPLVAALSEGVGGPVGTRVGRSRWWTPTGVVLLLATVVLALGMVQKAPCASTQWQDGQARYALMCYSDIPYLYAGRGFAEVAWPYTGDPQVRERFDVMEYPPGISYWAWGTAWATRVLVGSPDLSARYATPPDQLGSEPVIARESVVFTAVNAVGLALLSLLAAWALTLVDRRRPWDAAFLAASPTLALTGLINWDLLAVAMVAGALATWARGRPLLTGLLLGVGTATKLYPLFLLGGVLVICVRRRRWGDLGLAAAGTVLGWVVTNAPAYATGPAQWKVFWSFNADRAADLGSLWLVVSQASGHVFPASTINLGSEVFFVLWCLAVAALGLLAPRTPRLAQLGFLVVAGFLLVNKVYSPQYVLWLLPLAALARPRLRDQVVWQAGEVFYFAAVWWYLGGYLRPAGVGDDPQADAPVYWVAIVLRLLAELYLVAIVARDVWRPGHDPVRAASAEDAGRGQETSTRSNVVVV